LRRIGSGLLPGGIVGFLTVLCFFCVRGGLGFSRGNPLSGIVALRPRTIAAFFVLIIAGMATGVLVSLRTPDE